LVERFKRKERVEWRDIALWSIFYSVVGLESKDFRLAIHHGTQKRTHLSIESWIVDGENL